MVVKPAPLMNERHPCFRGGGNALLACLHQHWNGARNYAGGRNSPSPAQLWGVFHHLHADRSGASPECQHEKVSFLNSVCEMMIAEFKSETWIQPLSATLGIKDLRRVFKSETFSRAFIEPVFDFC